MSNPALPTIGRVVYFYRGGDPKPHAAIVADVNGYTVNLSVIAHHGATWPMEMVRHVDEKGGDTSYWDWMDWQKGQAKKTEELEAKLAAAGPNSVTASH